MGFRGSRFQGRAGLLAAAMLCAAGVASPGASSPARADAATAGSAHAPTGGVHRVECFELRGAPDGPVLGTASLHRRDERGATQLEWQIRFAPSGAASAGEEVAVWHVESFDERGDHWVWRERDPRGGRSVVLERDAERLSVTEWGGRTPRRSTLGADCLFPLELVELLRAGSAPASSVRVFDPLSGSVETLRVATLPLDFGAPGEHRTPPAPDAAPGCAPAPVSVRHELLRVDGSLFASFTFARGELLTFQWQRGGLIAVRVEEQRVLRRTEAVGFRRETPETASR